MTMGKEFHDLSPEELCDLMCGKPEDEEQEEQYGYNKRKTDKQRRRYPESNG